jgi:putative copper export protein
LDDITIARVLHLLAVVHWIGGVAVVTTVILPAVKRFSEPARRVSIFEEVEGRFSLQAKLSVTVAGLSGFYMTHRLDAWDRFADPQFWWMHVMTLVWAIFTFVLFIGEPLFLHAWFRRRAAEDADGTFDLIQRAHWVLLTLSAITVAGAGLGAHGALF